MSRRLQPLGILIVVASVAGMASVTWVDADAAGRRTFDFSLALTAFLSGDHGSLLLSNDALSGRGPTQHQKTRWPLPRSA